MPTPESTTEYSCEEDHELRQPRWSEPSSTEDSGGLTSGFIPVLESTEYSEQATSSGCMTDDLTFLSVEGRLLSLMGYKVKGIVVEERANTWEERNSMASPGVRHPNQKQYSPTEGQDSNAWDNDTVVSLLEAWDDIGTLNIA
ncbi:hypothetical protein QQX98_008663 [Neonectria punicea]|uniref:Uncharacterized protein n=1 Tax=Neonectria punicea TaxID=979145 RepID=A0ABR1GUI8_9HYPO